MDANALGAALAAKFPERAQWTARSPKRLYAILAPQDVPEAARWLRGALPGCRLATATGVDVRDGVRVLYHFAFNGSPLVVTLKTSAARPDPRLPSIAPLTAAADWIEREIRDLLGVEFEGHPDARPLVKPEGMHGTYPLRRDFDPAAFKEGIGERPEF